MKRCSKCKTTKRKEEFSRNKNSSDGLCHWCKKCSRRKENLAYKNPVVRKQRLERAKEAYRQNPEKHHARKRDYYKKIVEEVFKLLGNKCKKCGEADKRLLQIDHINGGGRKHKKSLDNSWWRYYNCVKKSVKKNKKEYRLLCANCNWIDGIEKGYRKSIWVEDYFKTLDI